MTGYSDRINHALAFAAKHHDQRVRRGTRLPYVTSAPNVALILTRYGQDDDTVVAGILHDAVEDARRDGQPVEALEGRIGAKFGDTVLRDLLGIVERRVDDDGIELSQEERKADAEERLRTASERGRWVMAAQLVHGAGTLLADLARTDYPDTVWSAQPGGAEGGVRRYARLASRLREVGFTAPIMSELGAMVAELERRIAREGKRGGTHAS